MKKFLLLTLYITYTILSQAQSIAEYYAPVAGLSGYALKTKLHELLKAGSYTHGYDSIASYYATVHRDLYYEDDSTILDIYSEIPTGLDPYNYSYEIPTLISGASTEGLGWNREHLFSQSFFYGYYPMYSDMHFVVPTDARVNQRRSNLPFGVVGTVNWTSLAGSKVGLSASPGYTLSVFEPLDEFKGDIARMLLYVAVRYETLIPFFQYTNERCPYEARQEKAIKDWQIALLRSWHESDPVSIAEIDKNNNIAAIQKNRNPFIDHPEWVASIWPSSPLVDTIAPEAPIYLQAVHIGKRFITISWEMTSETNVLGYEILRNDTLIGVSRNRSYTITDLDSSTTYGISVRAYNHSYTYSPRATPIAVTTQITDTFAQDLLISKIIHGSNHNKAIELYNRTGYTVDLRRYAINMRQVNSSTGSLYWSSNAIKLEGELANDKRLVLVHPQIDMECYEIADADIVTDGTPMRFDGVLAIGLYKDDKRIDVFGDTENSTDTFAYHKSYYRELDALHPTTSFDTAQWTVHPMDYCDSLGYDVVDTITSIDNVHSDTPPFVIYPNPNKDGYLHCLGDNIHHTQWLKIVDIQGKVIINLYRPFGTRNYIDVRSLQSGMYYILTDRGNAKFIKE